MSEDQNNFERLRQLLSVKRHEAPPPGYFSNFSAQIIAGIRSEQAAGQRAVTAKPAAGDSWISNFLQLFEFKPAFAGALASALCLVLIFGVVYADRPDSGTQSFLQNSGLAPATYAAMTSATMPSTSYDQGMVASNSPANSLQPMASLFESGNSLVQPVSFSPAGN